MKHLLPILFLSAYASSAQIRTASTTVGSSNDMDIEVTINGFTGVTSFEVSGPSSLWFAAAYNTTNMNGYAVVHNNSGGNPVEYTMNGNGAPTLQTTQNLQNITSSTSGTVKTFNYTRLNDTGNSNDYTFTTSTTSLDIAYAIGSGSSLAYHGPNRGSATLTFTNPCDPSVLDTLPDLTVCGNDFADVFGNMVGAGTYRDTIWSTIGCDSVIQVQIVHQDFYTVENEIDTTICAGETYIAGSINELLMGAGSYVYHDTTGCALDVHNIQVVDNEVSVVLQANGVLEAFLNGPSGTTFWYMCDQDSVIPPPTLLTLTPTIPGEYAYINQIGGCSDTSDCVTVTAEDLGLTDIDYTFDLYVKNKVIFIENPESSEFRAIIYNSLGQVVKSVSNVSEINMNVFADGIYRVRIDNSKGIIQHSVLIH